MRARSLDKIRAKLHGIEGRYTKRYFVQIFGLFPEPIRPEYRKGFKAYDGTNNIFNLAYEILSWKIHRALIKAKLEPYLGFLHSMQHGKPSLVCDFQARAPSGGDALLVLVRARLFPNVKLLFIKLSELELYQLITFRSQ